MEIKIIQNFILICYGFINKCPLGYFYLTGSYYQLSKRFFGLRYAFGHKVNKQEEVSNGGYELLGGIIFAQIFFKSIGKINDFLTSSNKNEESEKSIDLSGSQILTKVPEPKDDQNIDLSNPKNLQYIPENSRKCMLCLSYMINPSCAPCGHIFVGHVYLIGVVNILSVHYADKL